MWPELPIEFNVVGTPVSFQSENAKAKNEWKSRVLAAARNVIEDGSWAFDERRLSVTMFYFPQVQMLGDVDNIVKLILDALVPNVYLDDDLIDRVLVQRFDPDGEFLFASPSDTLAAAVALKEPVLYVRIAEVPLEGPWRVTDIKQTENAILDAHEPAWIAQGYKVVRHPTGAALPPFLERYEPDAVLLGRSPQVVVEVVRKGQPNTERKVRALNALLAEHSDWRLMLLYAGVEPLELPAVSTQSLKTSLASVRKLAPIEPRSSLLLLWATLEALGRRLAPEKTKLPQKPASIVELLAGAGFVEPSEAEQLRQAVQLRNRLVHGDLEIELAEKQILEIADIVEGLIRVLEKNDARSRSPNH